MTNRNNIIPITKSNNYNETKHNDVLLISYNEEAQSFTPNDCKPIVDKVMKEQPFLIVVCTQESYSRGMGIKYEAKHYQHMLKNQLEKLNYVMLDKYDASSITYGLGAKVIGKEDKNVRTRVYCNKSTTLYPTNISKLKQVAKVEGFYENNKMEIDNLDDMQKKENKFFKYNNRTNNSKKNKFIIKEYGIMKSRKSNLGTTIKTSMKGSISFRIIAEINGVETKMIFVNSHLYYNKKGNTGLKERKIEFIKIIQEFDLVNYWLNGYNVFFSGDLNFRLYPFNNSKTNINYKQISLNIIKKYVENNSLHKSAVYNNLKENDELYKFLYNLVNAPNQNRNSMYFYEQLLNSIDLLKLHLTSKYYKGHLEKEIKFYKSNGISFTNNNIEKDIFEIFPAKNLKGGFIFKKKNYTPLQEKKGYPRIPSNTDRILFALSDIEINPDNFNIYLVPDKSDHKMITLAFNILHTMELYETTEKSSGTINLNNAMSKNNGQYTNVTTNTSTNSNTNSTITKKSNNSLKQKSTPKSISKPLFSTPTFFEKKLNETPKKSLYQSLFGKKENRTVYRNENTGETYESKNNYNKHSSSQYF